MSNTHDHKFFIEKSFLDDIPIDMAICGICEYSYTKTYVDLTDPVENWYN